MCRRAVVLLLYVGCMVRARFRLHFAKLLTQFSSMLGQLCGKHIVSTFFLQAPATE